MGIFAVAKFTEGAWLIVIVFPALVFTLIRLNRQYRGETATLQRLVETHVDTPNYAHHRMLVLVDSLDLAALEALRYGRGLRPAQLEAVHFMLDKAHAMRLTQQWEDLHIPISLKVIECPDRRLTRAVQKLAVDATSDTNTSVTLLLPRRSYPPLLGRLLHDRTADSIAKAVSHIPRAAATIIPYNVQTPLDVTYPDLPRQHPTDTFVQP